MFFFFVCGEKTIRKELPGYEGVVCQCHRCHNMSGRVLKQRPFFTFCWIPIIPFSIKGYQEISCHICRFNQPLEQRPDVQSMQGQGGAAAQGHQQQGPQAWQGQYKGPGGPPPQQQGAYMTPPPQQGGYGGPPPPQGAYGGPPQQRYG